MRLPWSILLLALCVPPSTVRAQQSALKDATTDFFLIDTSKPYVYLEVDHVGTRRPLRKGEPSTGIWLHLKNNCKLPIVVVALGGSEAPKGTLILEDEVVPNPQIVGENARMTGIVAPHGPEEMNDIVRFPNMTEKEVRSAEAMQSGSKEPSERPPGYGIDSGFDALTLTLIPPGGQVLFTVPSNHVSETWHLEIPFRFALPNKSRIRAPYSYVAFYQEDLKDAVAQKSPMPITR